MLTIFCSQVTGFGILFQHKQTEDQTEESFTLHSSAERLWYSGHPDMEKCRSCFPVRCPARNQK